MSIADELYSWGEVEAVMCVWEDLLDRHRLGNDPALEDYWEWQGTSQLRRDATDIAVWIAEVWECLEYEWDTICFDWEFVPRMIDQLKWQPSDHMYKAGKHGRYPTPSVESGVAHYKLAYGY